MKERDSIATRNQNAREFAHGDTQELVFAGQLIAWRVDGAVYMMLGSKPHGAIAELNYMLSCLTEAGQADNARFFWAKVGYTYERGGFSDTAPGIGPNEVIRVST
tara:strand:+ start:404 stop:718 length:315 start_codon:yes stop_codon:yes gene_type:complete